MRDTNLQHLHQVLAAEYADDGSWLCLFWKSFMAMTERAVTILVDNLSRLKD